MSEEYVSCIGVSTAYALVEICKSLDCLPYQKPNRIQSPTMEHGQSCGIILLAVGMTESALNRAKYISNHSYRRVIDYFRDHFENNDVAEDLEEIYVLRDAIIHNHMWKYNVPNSANLDDPHISYSLLSDYGDSKFKRMVDLTTQKTKRLSLNVVPTKMNREDVAKVLDVVNRVCSVLQAKDERYFPLENYPLPWDKSTFFKFPELVKFLQNKWLPQNNV